MRASHQKQQSHQRHRTGLSHAPKSQAVNQLVTKSSYANQLNLREVEKSNRGEFIVITPLRFSVDLSRARKLKGSKRRISAVLVAHLPCEVKFHAAPFNTYWLDTYGAFTGH